MMGLVVLCASIVLAVLLPAFGVDRLLLGGSSQESVAPSSSDADVASIHIWYLLGIAGLSGLGMWFLGGADSGRTAKSTRRR